MKEIDKLIKKKEKISKRKSTTLKKVEEWNNHDDYSFVGVTWYIRYCCDDCYKVWDEESGWENAR